MRRDDLVSGAKGRFIQQAFNKLFKERCSTRKASSPPIIPPVNRELPPDLVVERAQAALKATFQGNCSKRYVSGSDNLENILPKYPAKITSSPNTQASDRVFIDKVDKYQGHISASSSGSLSNQQLPPGVGGARADPAYNSPCPRESACSSKVPVSVNSIAINANNSSKYVPGNVTQKLGTPKYTPHEAFVPRRSTVKSAINELCRIRGLSTSKELTIKPPVSPIPQHVAVERAQAALRHIGLRVVPLPTYSAVKPLHSPACEDQTKLASNGTLDTSDKSSTSGCREQVKLDKPVASSSINGSGRSSSHGKSQNIQSQVKSKSSDREKKHMINDLILESERCDDLTTHNHQVTNDLFKTILQKKGCLETGVKKPVASSSINVSARSSSHGKSQNIQPQVKSNSFDREKKHMINDLILESERCDDLTTHNHQVTNDLFKTILQKKGCLETGVKKPVASSSINGSARSSSHGKSQNIQPQVKSNSSDREKKHIINDLILKSERDDLTAHNLQVTSVLAIPMKSILKKKGCSETGVKVPVGPFSIKDWLGSSSHGKSQNLQSHVKSNDSDIEKKDDIIDLTLEPDCCDDLTTQDHQVTNDLFKTILQKKGSSETGINGCDIPALDSNADEKFEVGSDCSGVVVRPIPGKSLQKMRKTSTKQRSRSKRRCSSTDSTNVPKKRARRYSRSTQNKGNTCKKDGGQSSRKDEDSGSNWSECEEFSSRSRSHCVKQGLSKPGVRHSTRIRANAGKKRVKRSKTILRGINDKSARGDENSHGKSRSKSKLRRKQKTVNLDGTISYQRRALLQRNVNEGMTMTKNEDMDQSENISVGYATESCGAKYKAISRDSSEALSLLSELEKLATMPLDELIRSCATGELFRRSEMGLIGASPIKESLFSNGRDVHSGGVWNMIVDES